MFIVEDQAHVYRIAAACLTVTTNHVKHARDMYPALMVTISTDPVPPIILEKNLLCGMIQRNAVNGRARLAVSHRPVINQRLTMREHMANFAYSCTASILMI